MKNKKTEGGSKGVKLAVIGAGLAALAATTYFFLGPKGKKHQKDLKAWAIKMKGDVVDRLEKARDVSEPIYNKIIDSVAGEYKKGMKASHEEINELAENLKKHWKTINGGARTIKSNVVKGAQKVAKKLEYK